MNINKESIKKQFQCFKSKYWNDPVWSKVISAAIITITGGILTTLYVFVRSLINKIPFYQAFNQALLFFKKHTPVNNFILIISFLFILSIVVWYMINLSKSISIQKQKLQEIKRDLPIVPFESNIMFDYRLASAFPGQRGLKWYKDPITAVQRLSILLQEPLMFKSGPSEYSPTPFWWFRDTSSMYIEEFKQLSKTRVLMNREELKIKKIAVNVDPAYKKSFVYVETEGEKQVGINKYKNEDIKRHVETFGYSWEEFALLGNHVISRTEYDDGAAIINSKVVNASKSTPRIRYLTDYNFIITSHDSPYNSDKFELYSGKLLNEILIGKELPENLFKFLETFTANKYKS